MSLWPLPPAKPANSALHGARAAIAPRLGIPRVAHTADASWSRAATVPSLSIFTMATIARPAVPGADATADAAADATVDAAADAPPSPPPLSFDVVSDRDEQRDALRLVADAIAQQRQVASLAIIFHPACFVALAIACSLAWRHNARDFGSALMAVSGLVMAYLAAVRLYTSPFLRLAESFHCDSFLAAPPGSQDLVLVSRFGSEIIGTLVLRVPQPSAASAAESSPRGGLIRAWTTRLRYRNKGIGADLLRFAVAVTRSASGDDAPVAFAPNHANSAMPLFRIFSRPFARRDQKAATALQHALQDYDAGRSRFARAVAADGL